MAFKKILFIPFLLFSLHSIAQKKMIARYYGGHGCADTELQLFSDSTYTFISSSALLFAHTSRKSGYFLRSDSSITFFKKAKRMANYLNDKTVKATTYRIKEENILMYTVKDEQSKNSDFIKTYNTLRLERF
jgi:hypothetical protein